MQAAGHFADGSVGVAEEAVAHRVVPEDTLPVLDGEARLAALPLGADHIAM